MIPLKVIKCHGYESEQIRHNSLIVVLKGYTNPYCLREGSRGADIEWSPVWDIIGIINEVCSDQSYLKHSFNHLPR